MSKQVPFSKIKITKIEDLKTGSFPFMIINTYPEIFRFNDVGGNYVKISNTESRRINKKPFIDWGYVNDIEQNKKVTIVSD